MTTAASMPGLDAARIAAFDALRAVKSASVRQSVLPVCWGTGLSGGTGVATELAYGTLRGRGTYDAVLSTNLDRALSTLDPPVLDALRLGAHQVLSTRIPAHAAVSTTVDLTRNQIGEGPGKLVNAVLRRVSAHDLEAWVELIAPTTSHRTGQAAALRYLASGLVCASDARRTRWRHRGARPARSLLTTASEVTWSPVPAEQMSTSFSKPARDRVAGRPHAAVLAEGDPADLAAVASGGLASIRGQPAGCSCPGCRAARRVR